MNIIGTFSGFSVNDAAKAKTFYADILGLTLASEQMGLSFTLPNGGKLFVYEKSDHVPASFTILNFEVEDIDTAVDDLTSKGVTFEKYPDGPPQDEKGILRGLTVNMGPNIAWFKDPAGNILAVLQEK